MKKLAGFLVLILSVLSLSGQDITGQWNGILKVQGTQLRIVFNITKTDLGYSSTMDSPDQRAKGIPVTTTIFENSKLKLEITSARIEYSGELKGKTITGIFKQSGLEIPLDLSREIVEKQVIKRPQEPALPLPYNSEEISFQNSKENISLAGTLTFPKKEGRYPAVILITGSGPQNRDEELMGHKPFMVIADYLTRHGIAVLRYDDRGVGKSEGVFSKATSVDFATDVERAIAYLKTRKEIDPGKIGLVGHSEGGVIAPMVAAGSRDVKFIVLLAGTGIRGDKLLLLQQELLAKASGKTEAVIQKSREMYSGAFDLILQSRPIDITAAELRSYLGTCLKNNPDYVKSMGMPADALLDLQINQLANPWMLYFIRFDPATVLEKVKCPVLAVNGEKDLQVPAKVNLAAIENSLKKGGNKQVTTREFPNLNHMFQECKSGLPTEYAEIEQTFSPVVLDFIYGWILQQSK